MSVSEVVSNMSGQANSMGDIMIDLETLGLYPGSVILSLGAVAFNIERNELGEKFYMNIQRRSCVDLGMRIDPATEEWWSTQSAAAKAALLMPAPVSISFALERFCEWVKRVAPGARAWSNGLSFDIPLLRDAERRTGIKMPWPYRGERDTRTMFMMAEKFNDSSVVETIRRLDYGVAHCAVDDAIRQAKQMCELWRIIR